MKRAASRLALAPLLLGCIALGSLAPGCNAQALGGGSLGWVDGSNGRPGPSTRTVTLRWRQRIVSEAVEAFVPVERAVAALDPERDRIYVGSTGGELWAMNGAGGRVYTYDAGGSISAEPAFDSGLNELYLGTEDGVLHRLAAQDGSVTWRSEVGGAISTRPVLTDDVIFVATDDDTVTALDRESGEALWRVRRDPPDGFTISQHAGLTLLEGERLLAAFTSGQVISLQPSDGALQWERDTSEELDPGSDGAPRFADVDTTPLVIDDLVYVASFAGGMYALERESGTVRWRDEELTGVTSIVPASDRLLVVSSGDLGLFCFDRVAREILWRKRLPRGAPSVPVIARDLVMFGESQGGFVTVALSDGEELGRLETGHGFTARAAFHDGRGFVMSNGGTLHAFAVAGAR